MNQLLPLFTLFSEELINLLSDLQLTRKKKVKEQRKFTS
jgi:hypothetical protein